MCVRLDSREKVIGLFLGVLPPSVTLSDQKYVSHRVLIKSRQRVNSTNCGV